MKNTVISAYPFRLLQRNTEDRLLAAFQILRLLSETGTRGDDAKFLARQASRQGLVEQLTQAVLKADPGCQWSWCKDVCIKEDVVVIALLMVFHHCKLIFDCMLTAQQGAKYSLSA